MKNFILLALLAIGSVIPAHAQKIGFADLELILAFMPEAQQVDKELNTYAQQLRTNLQNKQRYLDTKLGEYQQRIEEAGENLPEDELNAMREDVQKLQSEIAKSQQDSEQKLMIRRQDKLGPVLDKIQDAIDALAEEEGYTFVLNSTSGGTSIALYAGEQYNVTENLMNRLNIPIPEDMQE